MTSLIDVLWEYVNQDDSDYYLFHSSESGCKDAFDTLERFLFSTMDEVRLRYANEYSDSVLACVQRKDMNYFRRSVLKREVSKVTLTRSLAGFVVSPKRG